MTPTRGKEPDPVLKAGLALMQAKLQGSRKSRQVVCLVGLRCSGKTTVGRALGAHLGWPVVDLDERLVEEWREPVTTAGELLAAVGEPAFREHESAVLARVLKGAGPLVLATGGGCVESAACRTLLAAERVVWLRADPAVLGARLREDGTLRPSLTGAHPADELPVLAERRNPWYAQLASLTLDATRPVEGLVRAIAADLEG